MWVARSKDVEPLDLTGVKVGGVELQGQVALKVLKSGKNLQLVDLHLKKGYLHVLHNHPEHESIGYVISGKLEMEIGGEKYVLEPGDCWLHGIGVYHSTFALEDTHAVEIHSPLRPEFTR